VVLHLQTQDYLLGQARHGYFKVYLKVFPVARG